LAPEVAVKEIDVESVVIFTVCAAGVFGGAVKASVMGARPKVGGGGVTFSVTVMVVDTPAVTVMMEL
jgi:hypothetical protein